MTIKLTPDHVGSRVLLSDGDVAWICRFHGEHVSVTGGLWIEFFDLNGAHSAEGSEYRITLLLDAPNPLDVEVPEWVDTVVMWSEKGRFFRPKGFYRREDWRYWISNRIIGWSPAPGEMPPRKAADNGE